VIEKTERLKFLVLVNSDVSIITCLPNQNQINTDHKDAHDNVEVSALVTSVLIIIRIRFNSVLHTSIIS